jgi:isoquinoline 1-oxidoreductase beta subunit
MGHDFYRPISPCKLAAGLDDKSNLVGLHVRVSGQSINAFVNPFVNPSLVANDEDNRQPRATRPDPATPSSATSCPIS